MRLDLGLNLGIINQLNQAILDQLSVTSSAAYSLRRLRNAYTGSAIRVRRSLDNAEADIGFSGTDLDETALMDFVGYQNLLTYSEEFDNAAWEGLASSAETIAVNSELAPDGTMTADRCTVIGTSSGRFQTITLPSAGQVTLSTYIKRGSQGTWARIGMYDTAAPGNQARCWFNMETGVLGTVEEVGAGWSDLTAEVADVGNDWYRVAITATCTATAISALIANANSNGDTARVVGHNRILWGAQLNLGALQPYSPTSRRNLLTFSEEFDNAAWTKVSVTVTPNTGNAPNNTQTADTVLSSAGTSGKYFSQFFTSISGKSYTYSMYAKQDTGRYLQLTPVGGGVFPITAQTYVNFDLQTGTVSSAGTDFVPADYSISDEGNGWYRISLTATATSSSAVARFLIVSLDTGLETRLPTISSEPSYSVFGGQVEENSELTGYQRVNVSWTATRDGNGFVTTWYDQSGNVRNATQATAGNQPQIVTGGVVITENGKPAWKLQTTTSAPLTSTGINSASEFNNGLSSFVVAKTPSSTGSFYTLGAINSNGVSHFREVFNWKVRSSTSSADANFTANANQAILFANISPSLQQIGVNGSAVNSVTSNFVVPLTTATLFIGANNAAGNASSLDALYQEIIIFSSDRTVDRETLERNQGNFYGITIA